MSPWCPRMNDAEVSNLNPWGWMFNTRPWSYTGDTSMSLRLVYADKIALDEDEEDAWDIFLAEMRLAFKRLLSISLEFPSPLIVS